jgi:hypothetical protein
MFECLILGDSIAAGLHQHKKECVAFAKGGINSWQFNKNYPGEFYSHNVIISLGSNDHSGVKTLQELEQLRSRVVAKYRVYWILPGGNHPQSKKDILEVRQNVEAVAQKYGDVVVPINHYSQEKIGGVQVTIHPSDRGYKDIATKIK